MTTIIETERLTLRTWRAEEKEIVSFTVPANTRSIRVLEKIGLIRDVTGDFAHPRLSPDHLLSKHILYRLSNNN